MLPRLPSDEEIVEGVEQYMRVQEQILSQLKLTGMPKEIPLPSREEPEIPEGVTKLPIDELGDLYDQLTNWYDTVSHHIALGEGNKETAKEQKGFVYSALYLKIKESTPGIAAADVDRLVLVNDNYRAAARNLQFHSGLLKAQKARLSAISQKRDRISRELRRRENLDPRKAAPPAVDTLRGRLYRKDEE